MIYYKLLLLDNTYDTAILSDAKILELKKKWYSAFYDKNRGWLWSLNMDVSLMLEYPLVFGSRGSIKIIYLKESELFNPYIETMISNFSVEYIPILTNIRRSVNLKNIVDNL